MSRIERRDFLRSGAAFAGTLVVVPLSVADGAKMRTPLLLETERGATGHGPGRRTVFFVKGCPLHCAWCVRPESISPERQTAAGRTYGRAVTIGDLVAEALAGRDGSGAADGGVTVSGGEPLRFWRWTRELLTKLRVAGLGTCVETSLYAPPAAVEALMPVTDLWLPDFKLYDDGQHIRYTGVSNRMILRNLELLAKSKAAMEVRLQVVPGISDGKEIAWRRGFLRGIGVADSRISEIRYDDSTRPMHAVIGMGDTASKAV